MIRTISKILAAAVAPVCMLVAAPAFGATISASTANPTGAVVQTVANDNSDFTWRDDGNHQYFGQTFTVTSPTILDAISFKVIQENSVDRSTSGLAMRMNVYSTADINTVTGTDLIGNQDASTPAFNKGEGTWLTFDVTNVALAAGTYSFTIDYQGAVPYMAGAPTPGGNMIGSDNPAGLQYNSNGDVYADGRGFRIKPSAANPIGAGDDLAFVVHVVPEPASLALLGLGLPLLMRRRSR